VKQHTRTPVSKSRYKGIAKEKSENISEPGVIAADMITMAKIANLLDLFIAMTRYSSFLPLGYAARPFNGTTITKSSSHYNR